MNKTTEALKLAEEIFSGMLFGTDWNNGTHANIYRPKFPQALAAIREALAKQEITTPDVCGEVCARSKLCYGCGKAFDEALAEPVNEVCQPDSNCVEADGCPTELAVLQRFWREQKAEPVKQEPVAYVTGYYGGRCVVEPLNRASVLPNNLALYAAPVDAKANAKERYDRIMAECEEPDPIERLRFFCSLAMTGKNWIDVEEFFDDLVAERKAIRAELTADINKA